MNIFTWIKNRLSKGAKQTQTNPNDSRFNFISDVKAINTGKIREYKVWYIGDSDELNNFYLNRYISEDKQNPIYNRNKKEYFWEQSQKEDKFKKVHSGIPNSIITTLTNAIGTAEISSTNQETNRRIEEILKSNSFKQLTTQEERPLTLVQGWGAFKISYNKKYSNKPIIQFYSAENVRFIQKYNVIIGVIFIDYYAYEEKKYTLIETRSVEDGSSKIEYELFRLEKSNEITSVPIETIPDIAELKSVKINSIHEMLAVPVKYFFDANNREYGKSIFAGKVDLFDDLDQCLSQASQTCRVSTPVEYYQPEMCERDTNGSPIFPKHWNRQYIAAPRAIPNGDGNVSAKGIETTQPQVDFLQYSQEAQNILGMILTGILSPATMGIDIAKKDNAEAQREKEKVTIMTRDNVCDKEIEIYKKLVNLSLQVEDLMNDLTPQDYSNDISVKFSEFAAPTFENKVDTLLPLFTSGAISTEMFVEKLYGDSLSEEEKTREIEKLNQAKESGDEELNNLLNNENRADLPA